MSSSTLLLDAVTLSVTRIDTVLAMLAAEDPDAQKPFDQTVLAAGLTSPAADMVLRMLGVPA